jgi:hypothetical protein
MTPERVVSPKVAPTIDTALWGQSTRPQLVTAPATAATPALRRLFLLSEFLLLFIGIPLALFFHLASNLPPLPVLWVVAVYCFVVL